MFPTGELKEYNFTKNGNYIGQIHYNLNFPFTSEFGIPINRNGQREIVSIGRIDTKILDNFIITSLNNYYESINLSKSFEEKKTRTIEYQNLYYLWQKVTEAKNNDNYNINNYYNDIYYRLTLLGYHIN